jgi:hypothetical protein
MRKKYTQFISLSFLFLLLSFKMMAQTGTIQGIVNDDHQQPIPYATVQLQGTTMGATTDDDGKYIMSNVPPGPYTLTVTYVGYANFSQSITVGSSAITVNAALTADYQNLNEVVVVGYGTKQIKDLTGSITSVGSDQFLNGNITTPMSLIAGKVAGVQIISNGGAPGAGNTTARRALASGSTGTQTRGLPPDALVGTTLAGYKILQKVGADGLQLTMIANRGASSFCNSSQACFAKFSSDGSLAPISSNTQSSVKCGRTFSRKSFRSSAKKAALPIALRSLIRSPAEISFVVVPPA